MFRFKNSYLEPTQLEKLDTHKYCSNGTSLSELFMQPYWRWLVTKVPLWLAPNLITFVGLLINTCTTLPVVLLDRNAQGLAPAWSYIACAVGFFIYQSLDAIDGKQARRTNSNTPMGELFDHGCDAFAMFLIIVSALSVVALHDYPMLMLVFVMSSMCLAFCYHWQTYVCGVLHFQKIDVTEAQFLHMGLLMVGAICGTDIWLKKVPYFSINLKMVLIMIVLGMSVINGTMAFAVICTSGVGKNGSTVADTSVLSPFLILLFQVPIVFLYASASPEPLHNYCMLFFLAMTFPLVKTSIQLVIGNMTKSPLGLFDYIMIGPFLAYLNFYLNYPAPEFIFLTVLAICNVVDVVYMCVSLCMQISQYLKISCFTIPSPS